MAGRLARASLAEVSLAEAPRLVEAAEAPRLVEAAEAPRLVEAAACLGPATVQLEAVPAAARTGAEKAVASRCVARS